MCDRVIGQVLDGLVLVLAMILNPRAKRAAQRGEQESRDGVRDGGAESADGGGTAMAVMPPSKVQEKSDSADHSGPRLPAH